MVKHLGKWWNDNNIDVVEIEGKAIALDGWNGECYENSFEVTNKIESSDKYMELADENTSYMVCPISEAVEFDEDGTPCQWETTEYKITEVMHK